MKKDSSFQGVQLKSHATKIFVVDSWFNGSMQVVIKQKFFIKVDAWKLKWKYILCHLSSMYYVLLYINTYFNQKHQFETYMLDFQPRIGRKSFACHISKPFDNFSIRSSNWRSFSRCPSMKLEWLPLLIQRLVEWWFRRKMMERLVLIVHGYTSVLRVCMSPYNENSISQIFYYAITSC